MNYVKMIVSFWCMVISLGANEGKDLFTQKCTSCHMPFIAMSKLKENFVEGNNTLLRFKAPTLNQLSYRLKQRIGNPKGDKDMHRMEVIAFMSDYVIYPDKDKSLCLDEVLKHFKTMPSQKGKVTEDELDEIGNYLYDFDNKVLQKKSVKYEGFDNALKRAKKENKIIMIKAMTKTCHFCLKMDREVLIEKEVIEAIQKDFIPVSIDVSEHQLPLGMQAKLTPSFIFIDKDSKVLLNVPGAWSKKDFLALLKEAKSSIKKEKK